MYNYLLLLCFICFVYVIIHNHIDDFDAQDDCSIFHRIGAFLARFCFLTEQGTFRYEFELGGEESDLKILLYYDAPDQMVKRLPVE